MSTPSISKPGAIPAEAVTTPGGAGQDHALQGTVADGGRSGKPAKGGGTKSVLVLPLAVFDLFTPSQPDGQCRWTDAVRLRAACLSAARSKARADFYSHWATQGAKVLGAVPES